MRDLYPLIWYDTAPLQIAFRYQDAGEPPSQHDLGNLEMPAPPLEKGRKSCRFAYEMLHSTPSTHLGAPEWLRLQMDIDSCHANFCFERLSQPCYSSGHTITSSCWADTCIRSTNSNRGAIRPHRKGREPLGEPDRVAVLSRPGEGAAMIPMAIRAAGSVLALERVYACTVTPV